jgi:hypothetical protein
MQLKLGIQGAKPPTSKNSANQYSIFALCNKCADLHEMDGSVVVEDGPFDKQSIGDLYKGKPIPKSLTDRAHNSITCPNTGRQSTQKNNHQIFLVPSKN